MDIAEFIRDKTGKGVTFNNWFWGGVYENSGFRTPDCDEGANLSAHKRSSAIDIKVKGMSPLEILDFVNDKKLELITMGMTGFEEVSKTPTWFHITTEFFWDSIANLKVIRL